MDRHASGTGIAENNELIMYRNAPTNNYHWTVDLIGGLRQDFFTEAGALDGIRGSGTSVLEMHFDWHGILAGLVMDEKKHLARWGKACDEWRESGGRGIVSTAITFPTLLARHGVPRRIDFIAQDIEESEPNAQQLFSFDKHEDADASVDGNAGDELLLAHGFQAVKNPFHEGAPSDPNFLRCDRQRPLGPGHVQA